MKWVDKGNELTYKARNVIEQFDERKKIYVFGAGKLGEELRVILERYGVFTGYIDNDIEKQKKVGEAQASHPCKTIVTEMSMGGSL